MRNLLYLFFLAGMLMGCRDNNGRYLDRACMMVGKNSDSLQYYLEKVDSASLTQDRLYEYYCLKLLLTDYSLKVGKNKVDSISALLVEHFRPTDHLAFGARLIRADYYWTMSKFEYSDSILDLAKPCIKTQRDLLVWNNYKSAVKWRMGDKDSSFYYLRQMECRHLVEPQYLYGHLAKLYKDINQLDSAVYYYKEAIKADKTRNAFYYYDNLIDLLRMQKKYWEGLEYMCKLRRTMKRSDIPYVNFIQGELNLELHRPDSAMKYYRIASETGNAFIASEAFMRMGSIIESSRNIEDAFEMYHKANRSFNNIYSNVEAVESRGAFDALKLRNQLTDLEVVRQKHVILLLGMSLFIVVLTGSFILYMFHRKKVMERGRLMQENIMLKQQEELSALREKEALLREQDACMREELFKRVKVFDKIPWMDGEQLEGGKEGVHINLSDADWAELRVMLDSTYHNFTRKLKQEFLVLSDRDINLCCLVKINVSLQSLADIYCISKNSVSRRKLRLKEKMGIGEGRTLDEFLAHY